MTNQVQILNNEGVKESILDFDSVSYTNEINGTGKFTITVGAIDNYNYNKYVEYQKSNDNSKEQGLVYFNRNGNLDFKGVVERINFDENDRMVLSGRGTLTFANYMSITANGNRASETLDTRVLYFITGTTSGTDELSSEYKITVTAGDIDNKASMPTKDFTNQSIFNALVETVVDDANYDFYMDYDGTVGNNDTLKVKSRAGSSTSIGIFVVGVDITRFRRSIDTTKIVNYVDVYGIYNQTVGGTPTGSGSDATSKAKYGKRMVNVPYVNKRLESNADCSTVGDNIIDNFKAAPEVISFTIIDPNQSFNLGDRITVKFNRIGYTGDFRIVAYTRTWTKTGAE